MKDIIVILADNWGSQKGGINSFNFDLINSLDDILSKKDNQECLIVCLTDCENISESKNIVFVKCDFEGNKDLKVFKVLQSLEKLLKLPFDEIRDNYIVKWWVGHDVITGEQAQQLCIEYNGMFNKDSKFSIIHHMSYEDYYHLKLKEPINSDEYKDKLKKQKNIIAEADTVFAIGPKLKSHAEKYSKNEVIELIPGIQAISKKQRKNEEKQTLITMLIGRIEEKEDPIKQHSLAIEALSNYYEKRFMGLLSGESQIKVFGAEKKDPTWKSFVVPYTYMDKEDVYSEICQSDIGFLISSHEGFGLVGWEFISAEIPLIISRDTGLYTFLQEFIKNKNLNNRILLNALDLKPINVDNYGDERKKMIEILEMKIKDIAENLIFYDNQSKMLKEELSKIYTWENLAATFLNGLKLDSYFETKSASSDIVEDNTYGIVKLTNKNDDRINDYKECLLKAKGHCFISGTSMLHLSEDSGYLLKKKIIEENCIIDLLLMNPEWAKKNSDIFTFKKSESRRNTFYNEIEESIERLLEIKNDLPEGLKSNLRIKKYSTFLPYILTGYKSSINGRLVVEITDYLPEPERLRFVIDLLESEDCAYQKIEEKFYSLWNNDELTMEVVNE